MSDIESTREFDCIRFVRKVRARIAEETAGMSNAERVEYYRTYPVTDPRLQRLVAQARAKREPQAEPRP